MDHYRAKRETAPLDGVEPVAPRGAAQERISRDGPDPPLAGSLSRDLTLRLVEGMTGPEIAAQTGLAPDSVRVNLCRGMKMLRELLETK